MIDRYFPVGGMPETPWGKKTDCNLVHRARLMEPLPATDLAKEPQGDRHSLIADAMFTDLAPGDFRVAAGLPVLICSGQC